MAKMKTRIERQQLFKLYKEQYPESSFVTPNRWRYMPQGQERRKMILKFLEEGGSIAVNNKWQPNTHYDPDIKRLLKKGKVRIEKHGSVGKRQTYLLLVSEE